MLKKSILLLFFLPLCNLYGQVYLPGPHAQIHTLPRGAYIACVDNITEDLAIGNNAKLNELIGTIIRHDLDFIALYGLQLIVDDSPVESAGEQSLRTLLRTLRNRFPKLKIAAVGGGRENQHNEGKTGTQEFESLRTSGFIFEGLSNEACPNDGRSALSSELLGKYMNPSGTTKDPELIYRAEVLKFFGRIARDYGFRGSPRRSDNTKGKQGQAARDYFDHLVLEDEWWWRNGSQRENLDEHNILLSAMRSILQLSRACDAKVITYESIQVATGPGPSLLVQADEISQLADRVLVTHYFKCVPNTLERYAEVIEAWGAISSSNTELWPLFSAEDQSAKVDCRRFDPTKAWNAFWGEWMDTTYTASQRPTSVCPNPGHPGYGYPYEVDEAEDLYLVRLDSASQATALARNNAGSFVTGNYQARGFMWFVAHLMDPHNRSMVGEEEWAIRNKPAPVFYPNPSDGRLQLSRGRIVNLYSASGTQIWIDTDHEAIDLRHLSPGLYYAEVLAGERRYNLKLILK
jgi:hypothetical protein